MTKTVPTEGILSEKQAEALLSRLIYSIEGIDGCSLDRVSKNIVIHLRPDADIGAIDRSIQVLMQEEKAHRVIGQRVYREGERTSSPHRSRTDGLPVDQVFTGSLKRGFAVTLFDQIDSIFKSIASRHSADLRKYPSMISLATLEKCRYIPSFPQNIHLVSEIPHRLEELERVKSNVPLQELARLSPYALSPAVCFHCYEELSGTSLSGPLLLTARGTCYRHEAPWRLGKHRLNEFSMREVVLFGDAAFVEETRRRFMDEVWGLFEALGLNGKIETSSDPFYFSEDAMKRGQQLLANMKYELIVKLNDGQESFSIASFNNMGDTLCKPFQVSDRSGGPMHSGCVAFGIDRWVYALLSAHGINYGGWPSAVRQTLENPASLKDGAPTR